MPLITSFRELEVYRVAVEQAAIIARISRRFPVEERLGMRPQMCRSARAVGALVAEAWGRRRYHAAFRNRLSEALGEASETQSWLDQALASGYLDRDMYDRLDAEWNRVGAMLQGMLKQSAAFCGVPGKGSSGGKKGPSSNGRK